jgi:solute carrier family 50 protein (sugar transporter)
MNAADVFMTIVAPIMGFVLANYMFFAGVPEMLRCKRNATLGTFNPRPFPVVLANCVSWIIYSTLISDYFLFFANAPGSMVGMYFTLVGYGLSANGSALREDLERSAMALMFALLAVALYLGLVASADDAGADHRQLVMGLFCNGVLLVYYASPLGTLRDVLAKKDASSLSGNMALANAVNGAAWFVYGAALGDAYLMAPNGVGAVLGAVQLALVHRYPAKRTVTSPAPSNWGSQQDLLEMGARSARDGSTGGTGESARPAPPGSALAAVGAALSRESLDGASRL